MSKKLFKIIRFFRDNNKESKIIKRNLTLKQARKHTNNPKTRKLTGSVSDWFDGYIKQN